ncbi:MAG TPA: tetratricopeptide repeat protein [candidate division Zixibacteria bacterium]|nr:tetratricopeptide repeat protein [candidate division Zixibacteria bacterium]
MPGRHDNEDPSKRLNKDQQLTRRSSASSETDWQETIANLMTLANEAAAGFDYDRAIGYLKTVEDIWASKEVGLLSPELRFSLHQEKGRIFAKQGKLKEAIDEYQKVLEFCRDSDQLKIRSETFIQIGQLLAKQGEHDRALGYIQRAIGAYRRLGDKEGTCRALRNLGVVYVDLGEFEEAEINYDEAISLARDLGEQTLYADLVNNLGTINNMKGDRERALVLYAESLDIYRTNNEIRKAAYTENNIGITCIEQERYQEAGTHFRSAYETALQIKDASLKLIVDLNLADLLQQDGDLEEARQHCEAAQKRLTEDNVINGHLAETHKIFGKIRRQERDYLASRDSFNKAIDIARQIRAQFLEAEILLERGKLHNEMDHKDDALNDLESSYALYRSVKAEGRREQTEKVIASIEQLYLDIFDSMAKDVDRKDKYTKGHSDRVASLALLLAKELGMKTFQLKTIVAGALLHDLGKVRIEDAILKKAGKLTDSEFMAIRKHPELGIEVLRGKEFPWDLFPLILHHHERLDGRGYPSGLKGDDIPLGARIICIADVFDALTSDRVYRKAYDTEKALSIMLSESGTAFDPYLLNTFTTMIRAGRADLVINSKTRDDEMFSIWSECMSTDGERQSSVSSPND